MQKKINKQSNPKVVPKQKTLATTAVETPAKIKSNSLQERVHQRTETSRKAALSRAIVEIS
jgi:hypothetical protein